jgi:hypothetical protein
MPVGLVNSRKPLGHSGQRRLQLVVGSNEIDTGIQHAPGGELAGKIERIVEVEIQNVVC